MLCIEGLMYWIGIICGGCMSLISVNGTPLLNTFYGPSRSLPSQTLSSTATTSTPTASSILQNKVLVIWTKISIPRPVVSTLSVTTTNPTTTTTNKTAATTLLTYTNTSSSTSTLTSTAISTPSSDPTDFDHQRTTSLEHEGNSTSTDSTSVWSTTSSPGSTVISVNGTPVFNTFYGPSRSLPSQTLSSTATTSTPTASSTLQYKLLFFGSKKISIDDPVVSTLSVTTTNPTTTTTNKTAATTLLTYTNTSSSTSTLTSTAISTPSSDPTDFDHQRTTSLEHEGNITSTDSTTVWSTTSSPGSTVQNASPDNQQNDNVDDLNTLGGVISGSVVGAFILLLALVAVCIFVGHRRNMMHEVRPEDEYSSMYVYYCVMALPFAYKP